MTKLMPVFSELSCLQDVYVARSGKLWCAVIRLADRSLCVYSPLPGLADETYESLRQLGSVKILLAPNHYHNRGIAGHVEQFPDADLISSSNAKPRLKKQTGLEFKGLEILAKHLPYHIQIVEPEGLKTGEVWLEITANKKSPALIVCDAFTSIAANAGEFSETPSMLGTFPKYGVGDRAVYTSWAKEKIARLSPTLMVPCHGQPVRNVALGNLLIDELNGSI